MSVLTRLSRAAVAAVAAGALAACDAHSSVAPNSGSLPSSTLAIASGQADAGWLIQGVVLGDRTTTVSSDTGGVATTTTESEHLAGVKIDVSREVRDSSGTSPVQVTDTFIGTVTSDASGKFELTSVPAGYYRLDLTPPAGSSYASGSSGTVAFPGQGASSAIVTLHSR